MVDCKYCKATTEEGETLWTHKIGFCSAKCYVTYMTKNRLWSNTWEE